MAVMDGIPPIIPPLQGFDEFQRETERELERYGFPKADPLFKARYAPAVRAWLDAQAGLSDIEPQVQDGQETWDDGGAKPDARADSAEAKIRSRSALLERRQRVAESEGLSRPLDPFTRRRHG
jgi:hypothetical protein